ncbi:Lrp/AsnC family transcriptional regulator [Gloeocapsopsis dulcis]|uniref:Lrp/AsnC family transcriptional regulator n=1 Tax=Gloeocapsopsis dulcis TaxID=2859516 RepID=UPI0018C4FF3F|nr:AsnC family transcriptional regulator [Gloeocapsopsis dulcis]WNN92341.1 AsnC family transcriptional regulator [Gloeocapsopsis dulcis]
MADSNNNISDIEEHEIDHLDMQITEYLQTDGRISYSYIARELGVPEATVRYRVKRLLDEEIIKISAFLNTGKLNYENVVYLELDVDPLFYDSTLQLLINMDKVSYIASVTGKFNVMMEYVYEDNDDLLAFLNFIKGKSEVRKTYSRTILKIHKAQYPIRLKS